MYIKYLYIVKYCTDSSSSGNMHYAQYFYSQESTYFRILSGRNFK